MRIKLAIKVIVTAVLLWLAFRTVDLSAVWRLLSSFDPLWLGGALLLTLLIIAADGLLLASVLRRFDRRVPFSTAMLYTLVGWFFSNVGPSTFGGDLYRSVQLSRVGTPVGTAVRAVLAMRLVSLATLILVMLAGFPIALRLVADPQGIAVLAGTVAASIAALVTIYFSADLNWRIPIIWRWALIEKLKTVSKDFRRLLSPNWESLTLWLQAAVQHLLRVAILAALTAGLGLGIPLETLFALTPAALLVAMVPVSVGGWGTREVAFVYLLGTAGVGTTAALSLSIAFGLLRIIVGVIGGLIWVVLNETHFRVAAPPA